MTHERPLTGPHLEPTPTNRGFNWLPPIPGQYGGHVEVRESSAASGPHLWLDVVQPEDLNKPDGPSIEATAHLTIEDALKLSDQLRWMAQHHYQGSTP